MPKEQNPPSRSAGHAGRFPWLRGSGFVADRSAFLHVASLPKVQQQRQSNTRRACAWTPSTVAAVIDGQAVEKLPRHTSPGGACICRQGKRREIARAWAAPGWSATHQSSGGPCGAEAGQYKGRHFAAVQQRACCAMACSPARTHGTDPPLSPMSLLAEIAG